MAYKKINQELPKYIETKISDFVKNKDLLVADSDPPRYDLKVVKELITTYREFLVDFIKKYDPSFLELINTAIQKLTTKSREVNKTEINKISYESIVMGKIERILGRLWNVFDPSYKGFFRRNPGTT